MQGLLLAAGFARRFGSDKLLAPFRDTCVALSALASLATAVDHVIAAVREENEPLNQALAAAGAKLVPCRETHLGMGASLACAAHALDPCQPVIVALADMPAILPETHRRVAAALLGGAPLCAPAYQGRRGHPVGFAAHYIHELLVLTGEAGARTLLQRDAEHLQLIPVSDPGVVFDVDIPADLAGLPTRPDI